MIVSYASYCDSIHNALAVLGLDTASCDCERWVDARIAHYYEVAPDLTTVEIARRVWDDWCERGDA